MNGECCVIGTRGMLRIERVDSGGHDMSSASIIRISEDTSCCVLDVHVL